MRIEIFILSVSLLIACNKTKSTDKATELKSLKVQEKYLKEKIAKLEAELGVKDTAQKVEKAKLVGATPMTPQPFVHYIEIQARVEGDEDVTVGPETPGTVFAILVQPGEHVKKGQPLATLDDKAMQESLADVKTQLDLASAVYTRQKNLWDQKIGSEMQYLQAKANYESMQKKYAAMREQWNMTRIKSPINGVVDDVIVKIGQAVAPGIPAFRVVNLSSLKIKGEVAESYISKVEPGNEVVIYFPDQDKEIKSRVSYSSQSINKLNRTFNVEVKIKPDEGEFYPNQVAVLRIVDYSSDNAYTVPVGAVQKSADGEFVYVATEENGKLVAKRKTIESGMTYGGMTEIKAGLDSTDKVITNGYQNVIDGDPIKL